MTEPLGPAFLSLPIDVLMSEVPANVAEAISRRGPEMRIIESRAGDWKQQLSEAVRLISESREPLLMVGRAVVRAHLSEMVRDLAESTGIPLVTSYPAMGVMPPEHDLNYGAITGYIDGVLDYPALDAIFGPVDLLISIGYDYAEDLRPPMWARGHRKDFVRIASAPNPVGGVLEPAIDVVCPLREAVAHLIDALAGRPRRVNHKVEPLRQHIRTLLADRTEQSAGLLAHQVIAEVNEVLDDGVFVTDVGLYRHFAVVYGRVRGPNRFLTSDGCSTFGFGLPAALAARMAFPDKPVILVCGDGGFHSNGQDLETAVRRKLPIVIVLLKNNSNELIRFYQALGHGRTYAPAVEFGDVDFVRLAEAQGCEGVRVGRLSELGPVLYRAVHSARPVLIETPVVYPSLRGRQFRLNEVS